MTNANPFGLPTDVALRMQRFHLQESVEWAFRMILNSVPPGPVEITPESLIQRTFIAQRPLSTIGRGVPWLYALIWRNTRWWWVATRQTQFGPLTALGGRTPEEATLALKMQFDNLDVAYQRRRVEQLELEVSTEKSLSPAEKAVIFEETMTIAAAMAGKEPHVAGTG